MAFGAVLAIRQMMCASGQKVTMIKPKPSSLHPQALEAKTPTHHLKPHSNRLEHSPMCFRKRHHGLLHTSRCLRSPHPKAGTEEATGVCHMLHPATPIRITRLSSKYFVVVKDQKKSQNPVVWKNPLKSNCHCACW